MAGIRSMPAPIKNRTINMLDTNESPIFNFQLRHRSAVAGILLRYERVRLLV